MLISNYISFLVTDYISQIVEQIKETLFSQHRPMFETLGKTIKSIQKLKNTTTLQVNQNTKNILVTNRPPTPRTFMIS